MALRQQMLTACRGNKYKGTTESAALMEPADEKSRSAGAAAST